MRQPIPAEPGQLERYDYEYRRNGTVNLFVVLDVNRPWRKVKVTERRAAEDYAQCMRELTDVHYPDAECIRVVQHNLSTHSAGARYEAFAPAEARQILRRLEFHYLQARQLAQQVQHSFLRFEFTCRGFFTGRRSPSRLQFSLYPTMEMNGGDRHADSEEVSTAGP